MTTRRIARAALAGVVVVTALAAAPDGVAQQEPFSRDGKLTAGNPANYAGLGVTENLAGCQQENDLNELDGRWFHLGGSRDGHTVALHPAPNEQTSGTPVDLDADAWFYDGQCNYIQPQDGLSGNLFESKFGTVPAAAAWVVIVANAGTGTFVIHIWRP